MGLFGSSGIRGVIDQELVNLAVRVGLAVGKVYSNVVVGTDTRTSSPALKHAVISGLLFAGARCTEVGIVPTPTLAVSARKFDAGVMITASHNPPEYNGIKLFNPDGSAFDAAQREQIEEMVASDSPGVAPWDEIKSGGVYDNEVIEEHIELVSKHFPDKLKARVVVDCGCGAASVITQYLLRRLGCEVIALDCYPSGFFPRVIEPIEPNLANLIKATREFDADLGIAHDGDADRMMAVDDMSRFIPGDKLMAVLARAAGAKEVVTTIDASIIIDEMGFKVRRTRVGDMYVSEELKKGGDFGGEPSGSWIFPGVSLCPDGIYAAAQLAAIAAEQGLSGLVDNIPSYPILRGSVSGEVTSLPGLELRLMAMGPDTVSEADGIKLNFKDGWLLVRPSGTEPRIRLTAEATSQEHAQQLYADGLRAINDCLESKEKAG